jgi:flavodoxin
MPPSLNEQKKMHPMAYKAWRERVLEQLTMTFRGNDTRRQAEAMEPGKMTTVVFVRGLGGGRREFDDDNFHGATKMVLDCLKKGRKYGKYFVPGLGIIKDDAKKYVKPEWRQDKTEVPGWLRVEIWRE